MTSPRIVSTTPPPKRLFPPLPADVAAQLAGTPPRTPEPPSVCEPPRTSDSFRIVVSVPRVSWQRHRRQLLASAVAGEILLAAWTLYASLVIAGVPLPAW